MPGIPALRDLRREKQELEATLVDSVGSSLQEAFSLPEVYSMLSYSLHSIQELTPGSHLC